MARAAAGRDLTLRMSLYNLVGYVAAGLGALTVAALPRGGARERGAGPAATPCSSGSSPLSGGVQALLYARLPDVPVRPAAAGARRFPRAASSTASPRSSRLDSFAGGFVLQSLLVYWLYSALRARAGRHRRGVLRGPAAHGVLRPARGLGRAADRAREHDGVLPPRLERPAGRDGARAHGGRGGVAPAPAGAPLADGRPDPAGLPDAGRGGRRARGDGDGDQRRPDRGAGGEPGAHRLRHAGGVARRRRSSWAAC